MYSPAAIANYFILKHKDDSELTPMKIIKLVYISYGWYLALTKGEKLVDENPEAWNLGPVFPSLYHSLKKYGGGKVKSPIQFHSNRVEKVDNEKVEKFLDTIWNTYGKHTGLSLSSITHTEDTPWTKIFPTGFNPIIPDSIILEHYLSKLNAKRAELVD